jgi:hypothetical protein
MFRRALRVVALLAFVASSCSTPQRTDHWMVERHMPDEEVASPSHTVCDDITDLTLRRFAGDSPALPLGQAAPAIDAASFTECEIPIFTALYLSTSFVSCHGRVALPVADLAPATTSCDPTASALFVPCFDSAAGDVPADCLSGDSVRLVDADWVEA